MQRERHKQLGLGQEVTVSEQEVRAGKRPLVPGTPVARQADGNGVAPGAETAVAQAAGSSGAPLPTLLRKRFEGSLGTDLGAVRVHTGAASQAATASVGARAYAQGQDIHFGRGQFDPGSEAGQHLIAHEVAHTVQQSGGAARPQFKLDVSTPGDRQEIEADRAADAMVRGAPASLTAGAGTLARATYGETMSNIMDIMDGIPVGKDSPVQVILPRNWNAQAASVHVDRLPGAWQAMPAWRQGMGTGPRSQAFMASWMQLAGSWNQVAAMDKTYCDDAADASAATAGLAHGNGDTVEDPEGEVWNSAPTVGGMKLWDVFATGDRPGGSFDVKKVGNDDRKKIIEFKRTQLRPAADAVRRGEREVRAKMREVANGLRLADSALSQATVARNNGEEAQLQAEKDELEQQRAQVGGVLKSLAGAVTANFMGEGIAKMGDAVGEMIGAASHIGFGAKISEIRGRITALKVSSAHEGVRQALNAYDNAMNNVKTALDGAESANDALKTSFGIYEDKTTKLGELMSVGAKGPPGNQDHRRVQSAVAAIGKLTELVSRCDTMLGAISLPSYSERSGEGAAICANVDDFIDHLSMLRGFKQVLADRKAKWQGHLDEAQSLVDSVRV
ncbi:MAG: DUF4157 domain-containing protein [Deltaproteobacteria bacterium]|nr:DUF4157 domain-containing protein [Deltaproteobacteria bacterium]